MRKNWLYYRIRVTESEVKILILKAYSREEGEGVSQSLLTFISLTSSSQTKSKFGLWIFFTFNFLFAWLQGAKCWRWPSPIQLLCTRLLLFTLETLCHNENVDGFYVISHNPSIEDIKEILDKKNTKNIEVYTGPHHRSRLPESKFEEQCTAYFKRYFENLAGEEPQVLPWKMANHDYTRRMAHWCQRTNLSSTIKGLVLHSFSILQHACRHGFTKEMLQVFFKSKTFQNHQALSFTIQTQNLSYFFAKLRIRSLQLTQHQVLKTFNCLFCCFMMY